MTITPELMQSLGFTYHDIPDAPYWNKGDFILFVTDGKMYFGKTELKTLDQLETLYHLRMGEYLTK
jgi:hypothetical protein